MDLSKASWRKSTRSAGGGNACVEVAGLPGHVAIRDSKNPEGPAHVVRTMKFRDLVSRVRRGDLDL